MAMALIGTAAAVALLYVFRSILWPFAFAVVMAILIEAFIRVVVRLFPWVNQQVAMVLCSVALLGLLLLAGLFMLPSLTALGGEAPLLQQRLDRLLVAGSDRFGMEHPVTVGGLIGGMDLRLVASWGLTSLRGLTSGFVLTALFLVFLLAMRNTIARRIRLAAEPHGDGPIEVLQRSIRGVESYLWIQTITGVMNGVASALVMAAVGLDHWLFWAVALFLLSYIPFLGVAVGSVGPALFALIQFPSPMPGVVIFLGIQAIAFVVGNLIAPKMQASQQNIDPCAGLIAVGVWSIVWGLPGAFLAIPLTLALIYQLAGYKHLKWAAILMSNDGDPLPKSGDGDENPERS
ncbi:MAG: AI-2E family transporter [Phenylobacterium sp.]|nr:AI-2E family transporter [Phenylobacterium sp.]